MLNKMVKWLREWALKDVDPLRARKWMYKDGVSITYTDKGYPVKMKGVFK